MTDRAIGVHLWFLPADRAAREALCERYQGVLSRDEVAEANGASRRALAERIVSRCMLLRLGLASHIGCQPETLCFGRAPSGRSVLTKPEKTGLSYSLSHSGGESVLGIATAGILGVDLESTTRANTVLRIASEFFPPAEQERISRSPDPAERALMHWCLKECVVKALERTVWDGLQAVTLHIGKDTIVMSDALSGMTQRNRPHWRLAHTHQPRGHVLSIALLTPSSDQRATIYTTHVAGSEEQVTIRPEWRSDELQQC